MNEENLVKELGYMLPGQAKREQVLSDYRALTEKLSKDGPASERAASILSRMVWSAKKKLDKNNNKAQYEKQNGNPVDPMHILHPLRSGSVWIFFLDKQVFADLIEYAHDNIRL